MQGGIAPPPPNGDACGDMGGGPAPMGDIGGATVPGIGAGAPAPGQGAGAAARGASVGHGSVWAPTSYAGSIATAKARERR